MEYIHVGFSRLRSLSRVKITAEGAVFDTLRRRLTLIELGGRDPL